MSGICPLLLMASQQKEDHVTSASKESIECLKGACAWYVIHELPYTEGCAVAKLSETLKTISMNLPK
jgi:hypothetical protein